MVMIMRYEYDSEQEERVFHEGSWGATKPQPAKMKLTCWVNLEKQRGGLEWYDIETGGNRFYAEGGLWFDDNKLSDFDGVADLPPRLYQWLYENELLSDWFIKHAKEDGRLTI